MTAGSSPSWRSLRAALPVTSRRLAFSCMALQSHVSNGRPGGPGGDRSGQAKRDSRGLAGPTLAKQGRSPPYPQGRGGAGRGSGGAGGPGRGRGKSRGGGGRPPRRKGGGAG